MLISTSCVNVLLKRSKLLNFKLLKKQAK